MAYATNSNGGYSGTIVASPIRPADPLQNIATVFSNEVKGSFHTYPNITERNALITERRDWGMLAYIVADGKTYQLKYGFSSTNILDNNNWVEFAGSGGGGGDWLNPVISILTTEPLLNADGDRYLVGTKPGDTITGASWSLYAPGFIAQYSTAISTWTYTIPIDGMSVRVNDQDNAVYRYEGTYSTGSWQKEKESQVRYISATATGGSYSATTTPYLSDYDTEIIYVLKFNNTSTGISASLSLNGLDTKYLKKVESGSLIDIYGGELSTGHNYIVTYNGTGFELVDPSGGGSGDLNNKYYIQPTETVTVPPYTQYWIYGDLEIDGVLDNYGHAIVLNGDLIVDAGEFNNYGTYSNLYFAEIDGLGQVNYIPRWKTSYMLTGSSSIYDDGDQVTISSPTFSISSDLVISNGASAGFILTSDANGVATWQSGFTTSNVVPTMVYKYTATQSFDQNFTYSITHGLNSSSILLNLWDEDTGTLIIGNVKKTSLNTVDIMLTATISNGRVVIIS